MDDLKLWESLCNVVESAEVFVKLFPNRKEY